MGVSSSPFHGNFLLLMHNWGTVICKIGNTEADEGLGGTRGSASQPLVSLTSQYCNTGTVIPGSSTS